MLWQLRFKRLCQYILKKPSGDDWGRPNNVKAKYGIRVPINAKEAGQFDKDNGITLWYNAILKEI